MRIRFVWEGKTRNPHLRALQQDYGKRIAHFTEVSVEELKPAARGGSQPGGQMTAAERHLLEKLEGGCRVVLDSRGREWSSGELAEWLGSQALGGRREVAFLVGGADGFSQAFREKNAMLFSLGRLTLTRDWARTLLMEQVYRAYTILRGFPYPR